MTFLRRESEIADLSHLSEFCRSTGFCMLTRSKARNLIDAARSLLSGRPFIIARDWHAEMSAKVSKLLEDRPDLVYVDHLQMFQFVPYPTCCPVLLDDHNVEWRIIERFACTDVPLVQRLFGSVESKKLRSYELGACRKADMVLAVTANDKDVLVSNGVFPDKVVALPVGVDTDYFTPVQLASASEELLMFGTMSWPPNADAVTYFSSAIYPLIKQKVPGVRLTVVGANPPPEINALSARDPSIDVTGYVDDIRVYAKRASVFVVPLRIGSGMRVKIVNAMALGLPIVTTSIGCEGVSLKPGEHALVADTPEEFADAVVHLLLNYQDRLRLGCTARAFVEEFYSWPPILDRLDQVLSRVGQV